MRKIELAPGQHLVDRCARRRPGGLEQSGCRRRVSKHTTQAFNRNIHGLDIPGLVDLGENVVARRAVVSRFSELGFLV